MELNLSMLRNLLFIISIFIFSLESEAAERPRLVLQLTVDQLRGDMLFRHRDRFGPGGFRYLLDTGTVYADARFSHANTTTAPGHATLATGGNVPQHGIAANDWYDRELGRRVNAVEDSRSPFIGGKAGDRSGRSPRHVTASTFSDELVLASGGKSRSFGVSTKDRGAIILAGKKGQAYWYSSYTGQYVTSTWYRDEYPAWVSEWNARQPAAAYAGATWDLIAERDSYVFAEHDDRPFELPRGELGNTFPHTMASAVRGSFYDDLKYSPWADELTLSFAKALIMAEEPGQRGHTDYLSVSFSATDYVGHSFGPNSLEAEDNLLRLDRVLAELLAVVDDTVGLDNTLIVLAADHGAQAAPEALEAHGFEAGRLGTDEHLVPLNEAMGDYFQTDLDLVRAFQKPLLYLDLEAVEQAGVGLAHAEAKLARAVVEIPGFSHAFTRSDLLSGNLPDTPLSRAVLNAFHPQRSGNVYVVSEPFWFFGHSPDGDAATHGTWYTPDSHVPVIFAGQGIRQQTVYRRVAPRDVAPTLSAYLGIQPPSSSVGSILPEIVGDEIESR
jgi:predicted AlkP superfamily pyrophosphatase or phosphodiesterase